MDPTLQMYIILGVLVIFIAMMLSGKVSFPLIGITCVAIMVISGAVSLTEGFSGFADKNVVMLAGMFPIAGQLGQTSAVDKIKTRLLSAKGGSDIKVVFLLLVITAILAQFIPSQTSIIMIMMTFLMGLGTSGEVTLSRMLLPITFILTVFMGKFPVGGVGVTTHLMLNQFIESAGSNQLLDVFSIMKCTLIPAVICLIFCIFTYKWLPKRDVDTSAYEKRSNQSSGPKLSNREENITYAAFIIAVIGLVLSSKLGDRAFMIPLVCVIVMIYIKAMNGRVFLQTLANGPVIMCATILAVSNAVTASGAGNLIGNGVLSLLGGNPNPVVLVTVFAVISLLVTTFVSNTAAFMVLVPIACNVCVTAGIDPRACCMVIFGSSLLSVMTPMSSGGAALAYSSCGLNIKDTFKWSCPLAILGVVTTVINCLIIYPM